MLDMKINVERANLVRSSVDGLRMRWKIFEDELQDSETGSVDATFLR